MQYPFSGFAFGVVVFCTTAPAVTSVGTALFLTHDRAGMRLVLGGDFPRELFGALHGSLLSMVRVRLCKEHLYTYSEYTHYMSVCQSFVK
jgi:hypothetical protein